MSQQLAGLEKSLEQVFVKNAPYQLPEQAKKWIVRYSPIIGLIFGVLGLFATLALWNAAHLVTNYTDTLYGNLGIDRPVKTLGFSFYIALISLLISSVISILAYPGLKAHSKARGWNLLFYSALISLIYGVFNAIYQGGVFSLVTTFIGSAIGLYFIFQIRSFYNGKISKTHQSTPDKK